METNSKENIINQNVIFELDQFSFAYDHQECCLTNLDSKLKAGEFVLLVGHSGSGKTTFLKQLKPQLTPAGSSTGCIYYKGQEINSCQIEQMATQIGYVFQNPVHQIVTDTVYHELAFGLENLGMAQEDMEIRIGEVASFFGIQNWFTKNIAELSGGQKQILNLAAILVMNPEVILLDEPTSQLDPIAASQFFELLRRIKEELGITIILSEHHVDDVVSIADRVLMLDRGLLVYDGSVEQWNRNCGKTLRDLLPVVARICPDSDVLSVAKARAYIANRITADQRMNDKALCEVGENQRENADPAFLLKDVWFRYDRDLPDLLKGVNLTVKKGECFGIVGGNGVGKSTLLKVMCGYEKAYSGRCKRFGEVVYMPQNPQSLFLKDTVALELEGVSEELVQQFGMAPLLQRHPYDLSGGEQQRLALLIQMKQHPDVLLLDEPTKGLDHAMKEELANVLASIQEGGKTIVIVSHDIDFIASYTNRCGLLFDGRITGVQTTREFMLHNQYYTTIVRRVMRGIAEDVTTEQELCNRKLY